MMPFRYYPFRFPDAEKWRYREHGLALLMYSEEMKTTRRSYRIDLTELQGEPESTRYNPVKYIWQPTGQHSKPFRLVLAASRTRIYVPDRALEIMPHETLELKLNTNCRDKQKEIGYMPVSLKTSVRVLQ